MVKKIIDIDVNSKSFEQFKAIFDKYSASLAKMPEAWTAQTGEAGHTGQAIKSGTAALLAQQEILKKLDEGQKTLARSGEKTATAFEKTERAAASIVRHVRSITQSLLRWGTISSAITGLAGFGSLWGLDRLAQTATAGRFSSMGLGLSYGQQKAFGINYSRFFEPNSVLSNVANAQANPNDWWVFSSMGLGNFRNRNPANLAGEAAVRAKHIFEEGGENQQYAEARGLLRIFTMDDLRRLHNMTDEEIRDAQRKYEQDQKALNIQPATLRQWNELNAQLSRSKTKITDVLINGLSPLTGPLGKLSDAVGDFLQALLQNKSVKELITDVTHGMEWLAGWAKDENFQKDMGDFAKKIENAGKALGDWYDWLMGKGPYSPEGKKKEEEKKEKEFQEEKKKAPDWTFDKGAKYSNGNPKFDEKGNPLAPGFTSEWRRDSDYQEWLRNIERFEQSKQGLEKSHHEIMPRWESAWSGSPAATNFLLQLAAYQPDMVLPGAPNVRMESAVWGGMNGPLLQNAAYQPATFESRFGLPEAWSPYSGTRLAPPSPDKAGGMARLAFLETKYGLPKGLLGHVWGAESDYGRDVSTSSAGAMGPFQLMPENVRELGVKNPWDFQEAADAAARNFRDLLRQFRGNVAKAVAAYNWGPGNIRRAEREYGENWQSDPRMPRETRDYLAKVMPGVGSAPTVTVVIENRTGSSVSTTVNSAAAVGLGAA